MNFSRLSAKSQRKAVAKDILKRLKTEQYIPVTMTYVDVEHESPRDLQKAVIAQKKCTVCALGGAICSVAFFEDKIRTSHFKQVMPTNLNTAGKRLIRIFGKKMLALIEKSFEGGGNTWTGKMGVLTFEEQDYCSSFHHRFCSNELRFKAIWTQVAKTGEFDPTK